MFPAGRMTDMHVCPMFTAIVPHVGGPVVVGVPTVMYSFMPAARLTSMATCVGPPDTIVMGSPTVFNMMMPAAKLTAQCAHGGIEVLGSPTVFVK